MSMRGLTAFITELRNCKTDEEEQRRVNKELANIRTHFKDKKLSGYNRKKYVSKLIFMTLAGYNIDFDQKIVEDLVRSEKYSEKSIGYLSFSVMIQEQTNITKNLYNAILSDLTKTSEVGTCLSLHAISMIDKEKIAKLVYETVYGMVISYGLQNYQKKKAALCLSILIRRFPQLLKDKAQCEELISYLNHSHLINISNDFSEDYLYHSIPAPWLQIKLIRILQYLKPPTDTESLQTLESIIQSIFSKISIYKPNLQSYNIANALIVEAINLTIHLGNPKALFSSSLSILGKFISARDINLQYIGLDAIGHLASVSEDFSVFSKYKNNVYASLKFPDISIQSRAIDLLFAISTIETAKETVEKLMKVLRKVEPSKSGDLAAKIAILTEKFATEYTWYVDVMFELVSYSGNKIDSNIWQRVIQVVLTHEELQRYAVKVSLASIKPKIYLDAVKVHVYFIGELGHLVAAESDYAPLIQLEILDAAADFYGQPIHSMVATAICKVVSHFPEISEEALKILEKIKQSSTIPIQQKINEYIALIKLGKPNMLQAIFTNVDSPVYLDPNITKKLLLRSKSIGDRRTWVPESRILKNEDSNLHNHVSATNKTKPLSNAIKDTIVSVEDLQSYYNNLLWDREGRLFVNEDIEIKVRIESSPPRAKLFVEIVNITAVIIRQFEVKISQYEFGSNESDKNSNLDDSPQEGLQFIKSGYRRSLHSDLKLLPKIHLERTFDFVCNSFFDSVPELELSYLNESMGTRNTVKLPVPINFIHFIEPVKLSKEDFMSRWSQLKGSSYENSSIFSPNTKLVSEHESKIPKEAIATANLDQSNESSIQETENQLKNMSLDTESFEPSPFVETSKEPSPAQTISGNNLKKDIHLFFALSKVVFPSLGFFEVEGVDPDPESFVGVGIATTKNSGRFGTLLRFELDSEKSLAQLTLRATSPEISSYISKQLTKLFGK
ncbi:hypothetical protein BB560_004334 [Smittium megazygosporum]|uniref:AP-2 complex subunit alpha n=1 Tax=Smittium megazygosporum TaxID=133381 RepID=A0A2T9Z9J2_9FUNG|nr:hypothetical protein BB560_005519 [Smittium megazygosporum]PVV01254.1 hypothetical protein BB560_004334 [Smittium megazygosporum]